MKYFSLLIFMLLTGGTTYGQYIITIAGDDTIGFAGDGGPAIAAKLDEPTRARPDRIGNVYIADLSNNRIRMVNTSGVITTIAGTGGGYCCDRGPATAAGVEGPTSVIVDTFGNIYISETGSSGSGSRIRKISSGIITTFAGGGLALLAAATVARLLRPRFRVLQIWHSIRLGTCILLMRA